MKTTMKIILVSAAIALGVALGGGAVFYHILVDVQRQIVSDGTWDQARSVSTEDGLFLLVVFPVDDPTGLHVGFEIESIEVHGVVFQCPDTFRAMDLKFIEWDRLDVVVKSGDVGTIVYAHTGDTWVRQ